MKVFYAVLIALYGVFFWWYGGSGDPVTAAELEVFVEQVRENSAEQGVAFADTEKYMRNLAASDNGREFLMVNLMDFRDRAMYPEDSPWADEDDAMAADERYSALIVPLLLKRAGHPVLVAPITGKFIIEGEWGDWDSVAVVRYRSVRDMLEMIVDMSDMGNVAVHKWASMQKTQVFPAQATISLLMVRTLVAIALISIALVVRTVVRLVSPAN